MLALGSISHDALRSGRTREPAQGEFPSRDGVEKVSCQAETPETELRVLRRRIAERGARVILFLVLIFRAERFFPLYKSILKKK